MYEVLDGLLISLTDPRVPLTKDNALGGWSGVAVWVLIFPILIPNTRGKIILATLATAAMEKIADSPVWTPLRARQWWLEHPVAAALPEDETVALAEPVPAAGRRIGPAK